MSKYIDYNGAGKPVSDNEIVEVVLRNGESKKGLASIFEWDHEGSDSDIVAYAAAEEKLEVLNT